MSQKTTWCFEQHMFDYKGGTQEMLVLPSSRAHAPTVVFIHGHNASAWHVSFLATVLHREGFTAVLPSMRGYGFSKGDPDFCGPLTVGGIEYALEHSISPEQREHGVYLWGVSRGATVAAQLLTRSTMFSKGVLQSGVYDMEWEYAWEHIIPGIKDNIEKETDGASQEALRARSAVVGARTITADVLLLHGEKDENISVAQARLLDDALTRHGIAHTTHIFQDRDHYLSRDKTIRRGIIIPFLKEE